MPDAQSRHKIAISAVVTRADGTVEDLGVVSHHHPDQAFHDLLERLRGQGVRIDESHVLTDTAPEQDGGQD